MPIRLLRVLEQMTRIYLRRLKGQGFWNSNRKAGLWSHFAFLNSAEAHAETVFSVAKPSSVI